MAPGAREKAVNGQQSSKARLGTFQGVFVPTSLNIFSILVFLRFGFILGQSGVIGFFGRSRFPEATLRRARLTGCRNAGDMLRR